MNKIIAGLCATMLAGCGMANTPTTLNPTLTVKNYQQWCGVSVNGGSFSNAATQTVSNVSNTSIALSATPISTTFQLGYWRHTTGDAGNGDPGSVVGSVSSTTVAVTNTNACVWVCCPFATGPGECPSTDQCS